MRRGNKGRGTKLNLYASAIELVCTGYFTRKFSYLQPDSKLLFLGIHGCSCWLLTTSNHRLIDWLVFIEKNDGDHDDTGAGLATAVIPWHRLIGLDCWMAIAWLLARVHLSIAYTWPQAYRKKLASSTRLLRWSSGPAAPPQAGGPHSRPEIRK